MKKSNYGDTQEPLTSTWGLNILLHRPGHILSVQEATGSTWKVAKTLWCQVLEIISGNWIAFLPLTGSKRSEAMIGGVRLLLFLTSFRSPEYTRSSGWIVLFPSGTVWPPVHCHNSKNVGTIVLWVERGAGEALKKPPLCGDRQIKKLLWRRRKS